MTILPKLSFAITLGSATFAVAASIPKTILPDNVIRCEPNTGCTSTILNGHNYKVLNTPRFTVMVAVSHEGSYTRADVSVTNKTDTPLNLTPDDFRVEVLTPKPKVLLYVAPADLVLPTPPAIARVPQPPAPRVAGTETNFVQSASDASVTYDATKDKTSRDSAGNAASESPLSATLIPPNQETSGRVYFERDKHAHLVNVVLPIAGLVFEFPYAMKK